MDILKRISNVWKLSEWEPSSPEIEKSAETGTMFAPLVKKPHQKAEFIPYNKVDPIKELVNEKPQ